MGYTKVGKFCGKLYQGRKVFIHNNTRRSEREKEWGKDFLKRLGKANVDIAPGTHLARNGRQSLLDYARFD